jgi:hypothetical protein
MKVGHLKAGLREWVATACVVAGVALFVVVSNPRDGNADPGPWMWFALMVSAGLGILAIAGIARGPSSPRRAALLAIDAGIAFGLLSVLTKSVIHLAGHGAGVLFSHFEPYALICVGVSAFVFSQSAYQAAPITSSMPVFDVVEPVVAVLIGATVLDERLAISGMDPLLEVVGAVAAIAGVVGLARSQVVRGLYERSHVSDTDGPRDAELIRQR